MQATQDQAIWAITLVDADQGDTYHFASLDGEYYLGVTRLPEDGDADTIQQLMDGDGNFKPMLIHRGHFARMKMAGDSVTYRDPSDG